MWGVCTWTDFVCCTALGFDWECGWVISSFRCFSNTQRFMVRKLFVDSV